MQEVRPFLTQCLCAIFDLRGLSVDSTTEPDFSRWVRAFKACQAVFRFSFPVLISDVGRFHLPFPGDRCGPCEPQLQRSTWIQLITVHFWKSQKFFWCWILQSLLKPPGERHLLTIFYRHDSCAEWLESASDMNIVFVENWKENNMQ